VTVYRKTHVSPALRVSTLNHPRLAVDRLKPEGGFSARIHTKDSDHRTDIKGGKRCLIRNWRQSCGRPPNCFGLANVAAAKLPAKLHVTRSGFITSEPTLASPHRIKNPGLLNRVTWIRSSSMLKRAEILRQRGDSVCAETFIIQPTQFGKSR
jgi:hypothetical protein